MKTEHTWPCGCRCTHSETINKLDYCAHHNAHEELVEALEALVWQAENHKQMVYGMALEDARAALAKAKGERGKGNDMKKHWTTTEFVLTSEHIDINEDGTDSGYGIQQGYCRSCTGDMQRFFRGRNEKGEPIWDHLRHYQSHKNYRTRA